jgi:hypothetical protein
MKSPHAPRRGTAVAVVSVVLAAATAQAAPKKTTPSPVPAEAPAPAPAPKKSVFGKLKSTLGFKPKAETPAPAEAPAKTKAAPEKPAVAKSKTKPEALAPVKAPPAVVEAPKKRWFLKSLLTKSPAEPKPALAPAVPNVAAKKKPSATPAPEAAPAAPEKRGFLKSLFARKDKPAAAEPSTEPKLAGARTANPEAVKPAKKDETALAEAEAKPKHSLFSFLRRDPAGIDDEFGPAQVPDSDKIERPGDWAEHRVVQEDEIALYEFGPSQSHGPDARLSRGSLVKVKKETKGWALVEMSGGRTGYIDAYALRAAVEGDFNDPAPVIPFMASVKPEAWAPLAPPPDLPAQPGPMNADDAALLLLPPLELEPTKAP